MHVVHTRGEMVGCPPAVGSVTGSGARGTHTGGDGRLSTSGGFCYRVWCTWYTHWGVIMSGCQ